MKINFSKLQDNKKEWTAEVISLLSAKYPIVKIQLNYRNPFELLIATMLSAQCTDKQVNIVTQDLFQKYIIPEDYLQVPIEELERDIYSTGFYKAKAKNIRGVCQILINQFNGKIPNKMSELIKLPGVGRKTANVVLGHCFNTPEGIVVDTHVIRICNLIGLVDTKDAYKIELELMKFVNKELWVNFTHYFIYLGREICIARRPKCEICPINHLCKYYQNKLKESY